ncbi:MAG: RNA polymerase sigma factor [Aggregatilineales bacterium]
MDTTLKTASAVDTAPHLQIQTNVNRNVMPQITPDMIQRAQRGDEAAVSTIYNLCADRIYRYIACRLNDDMAAEDLTADVFVQMVRDLPRYRMRGAPFEAWLYRIAANRVTDYFRKQQRRPETSLPESLANNEADPESSLMQQQQLDKLYDALTQLKEEEQLVLTLRFVERRSHREVAKIAGKSVSAVRSIQHRALARLHEWLRPERTE